MYELLWFLLPVAALSGWGVARIQHPKQSRPDAPSYHAGYLKGLNYLVNEEPDKALDAFIQALEVDTDTVETHLALGGLFRRRGEIDRAIRIHENLIGQPRLTPGQLAAAKRELARDYMRAGLLDRAEDLLQDLVATTAEHTADLVHLLEIYQQEREWEKAGQVAEKLNDMHGQDTRLLCAHFCCELAELRIGAGDDQTARNLLEQARMYDPACVRTSILAGKLEQSQENYPSAITAYEHVAEQDIAYMPVILPQLRECYLKAGNLASMKPFLEEVARESDLPAVSLALAELMYEAENPELAGKMLAGHIARSPSLAGIGKLMDMTDGELAGSQAQVKEVLRTAISSLREREPVYRCQRCGFEGQTLHWRCPSCKSWGLVKPAGDANAA